MTRSEAIANLKESFGAGSVVEQALQTEPSVVLVIITAKQSIPKSTQTTQVAFKLPADITTRPQHFVELHLVLPDGQQPNNTSTQDLNGHLWKTWSMNSPWDPLRHTLTQLVDTVVKQWDR
jgi:hypothetical protein